jgi:hypothetical protein
MKIVVAYPVSGEAVYIRRFYQRAVAAYVGVAGIVHEDIKDIWRVFGSMRFFRPPGGGFGVACLDTAYKFIAQYVYLQSKLNSKKEISMRKIILHAAIKWKYMRLFTCRNMV